MSMGWYRIPRSSMASSRAPTTYRASCRSAHTEVRQKRLMSRSPEGALQKLNCTFNKDVGFDVGRVHTSTGVCQLGPAEEAQISRPSPDGLCVSKTESGAEVVRLQRLIAINSEVTAGVVTTVDPDLQKRTMLV